MCHAHLARDFTAETPVPLLPYEGAAQDHSRQARFGFAFVDGDDLAATIDLFSRYHRHHHRSEEHTSELQSHLNLVCRLLLEKKKRCHARTTRLPHAVTRNRTHVTA